MILHGQSQSLPTEIFISDLSRWQIKNMLQQLKSSYISYKGSTHESRSLRLSGCLVACLKSLSFLLQTPLYDEFLKSWHLYAGSSERIDVQYAKLIFAMASTQQNESFALASIIL